MLYMSNTLTIRTDEALRQALQERAKAEGKTLSETVRQLLAEALRERPLSARAGHLKGRLKRAPKKDDLWRSQLRERNWRK